LDEETNDVLYGGFQIGTGQEDGFQFPVGVFNEHPLDPNEFSLWRCIKCNGDSLNFVAKKNNQLQRYDFLPSSRS